MPSSRMPSQKAAATRRLARRARSWRMARRNDGVPEGTRRSATLAEGTIPGKQAESLTLAYGTVADHAEVLPDSKPSWKMSPAQLDRAQRPVMLSAT